MNIKIKRVWVLKGLRKFCPKLYCAVAGDLETSVAKPDLRFVKKFTRPDFRAKNFTH